MHTVGRIPIRLCLWLCARVRHASEDGFLEFEFFDTTETRYLARPDSMGGCVSASVSCAVLQPMYDAGNFDAWCAECSADNCNSATGLSVGALSIVILGTVMQILA